MDFGIKIRKMEYTEIEGDLIEMAKLGRFDVITHGCNCFCTMGAGIAPQMAKAFSCDVFSMEKDHDFKSNSYIKVRVGDVNKLGNIQIRTFYQDKDNGKLTTHKWHEGEKGVIFYENDYTDYYKFSKEVYRKSLADLHILTVINAYTQYHYGKNHKDGVDKPLDYEALTLCMQKINHTFPGKHIGLPLIGCGLAGGDWERVKAIIQKELFAMDVTIVHYKR